MFTQQAPFLLAALQNSVDSSTAMQMAQAFGNCNQPLSHRAGVTLHRSALPQSGGVLNGPGGSGYSYADGAFGFTAGNDPATQFSPWAFSRGNYYGGDSFSNSLQFAFRSGDQFMAAYPDAAANAFYNLSQSFQFGPISTVNNSPWYTRMGDVNNFDFTTRLGDNINNFAGPTFQVAGDSYFDNSFHNNQTVNNQTVNNEFVEESNITSLNVQNIFRAGGDPGEAGPAGPPGQPGQPGIVGIGGRILLGGGGYSMPFVDALGPQPNGIDFPTGQVEWPANKDFVSIPTYDLQGQGAVQAVQSYTVGGSATVDIPEYVLNSEELAATVPKYKLPDTLTITLPSITFNPETCSIEIDDTTPGETVEISLSDTSLSGDGTDDVAFTGGPYSLTGNGTSPLACDVSLLTVAPDAAVPLNVDVGTFVVAINNPAGRKVTLPVPTFKGDRFPLVKLGPGPRQDLVPKPNYP
jgi:hypothetical protein